MEDYNKIMSFIKSGERENVLLAINFIEQGFIKITRNLIINLLCCGVVEGYSYAYRIFFEKELYTYFDVKYGINTVNLCTEEGVSLIPISSKVELEPFQKRAVTVGAYAKRTKNKKYPFISTFSHNSFWEQVI